MAVVKGIETLYGVSFSYHKISDVHIIIKDGDTQLRITVDSYLNKEARDAGKQPVKTENIISHADFALSAFYALLKGKFADYADSEDVFEEDTKTKLPSILTQQTPQGKLISQVKENE